MDKQTTFNLFDDNIMLDLDMLDSVEGFDVKSETKVDPKVSFNTQDFELTSSTLQVVFDESSDMQAVKMDVEENKASEFETIDIVENSYVEEVSIKADEEIPILNKVEYGKVNIMVIGIGSCGCNAINRMYAERINDIKLVVMDTSAQSLEIVSADYKLLVGEEIFGGHGSGGDVAKAEKAFIDAKERIQELLRGVDMVFIAGGLGRGTGSTGLVEVGKMSRELGILTIGFATLPSQFEFNPTIINKYYPMFVESVDSNIVVENMRVSQIARNLPITEAMKLSDAMLVEGIKGIFELITKPGKINLDYADIRTAFSDQGSCVMGIGRGRGEDAISKAIQDAIHSDIANIQSIKNSKTIVFNITCAPRTVTIDAASKGTDLIYTLSDADNISHLLFGYSYDETLEDEVRVTFIATGTTPTEISYLNKQEQSFIPKPAMDTRVATKNNLLDELSTTNIFIEESSDSSIPDFTKR